jgi:hypothetical protein
MLHCCLLALSMLFATHLQSGPVHGFMQSPSSIGCPSRCRILSKILEIYSPMPSLTTQCVMDTLSSSMHVQNAPCGSPQQLVIKVTSGAHCNSLCDIVQRLLTSGGVVDMSKLRLLQMFVSSLPSGLRTKALQRKISALCAHAL